MLLNFCGMKFRRGHERDSSRSHSAQCGQLGSAKCVGTQRLPLQQFHGDEGSPIGLINLVDRADVRVIQRGRSLSLSLETAEGLGIVGEFVGKELQGDMAAELQIFGFKDHTHAPAADLAEYAVMRNRLPHGLGRSGH
jgi:hypothetical protein